MKCALLFALQINDDDDDDNNNNVNIRFIR